MLGIKLYEIEQTGGLAQPLPARLVRSDVGAVTQVIDQWPSAVFANARKVDIVCDLRAQPDGGDSGRQTAQRVS